MDELEDLDELKALLADEGAEEDDAWSAEAILEEAGTEQPSTESAPPGSRRRERRTQRDRHADDEQVFRDLDSQLSADALDIKVDESQLTVSIGRLSAQDTVEDVRAELHRHRISAELDTKSVVAALQRAASGRPQYDVVVARGSAPVVRAQPQQRFHLPDSLTTDDPQPLAALQQAIAGTSLQVVEAWVGPTCVVRSGDVLADIAPADYDPGVDVYGQPIEPEFDEVPVLTHGEYTALSEDGQSVVATHYGYAGTIGSEPTVVPPVFVSSDGMEAHFVVIKGETMPAPTPAELTDLLQARWVEFGYDDEALERLCRALDSGKPLARRSHLVAEGRRPQNGADAVLEYTYKPSALVRWNDLHGLQDARDRASLAEALDGLLGTGRTTVMVHAGDVIARRTPAGLGTPGCDIRGEELPAEDGAEQELNSGLNTELDDDGLQLQASCLGLLAVYGEDQLSVVPPVWISADRLTACYLHLDPRPELESPTAAELQQVVEGDIDLSAWEALRPTLATCQEHIIPLAEGQSPQPGADGRFEWAVQLGGRAGRILEDGSIDLRDRQVVTVVDVGDLLGTAFPAKHGTPGQDVFGAELQPDAVAEVDIKPDARIEARERDDGGTDYIAKEQGGVSCIEEKRRHRGRLVRRLRLSLFAVSEIKGDVDYNTGHVDFQGDVVIKGSVKPLFHVNATGSVTIEGDVEPGAQIESGGDVAVGGGILGERTTLQVAGGLQAKFIEQATVCCGGSVEVGGHLFEASVRAGGDVTVAGKGGKDGRTLIGGLVWAGGSIETASLGSPSNPHLRVIVGVDPAAASETERLHNLSRLCAEQQQQILQQLGQRHIDARRLQRLADTAEADKRTHILNQLQHLVDLGLLRRDLRARSESLAQEQRERARRGTLAVAGPVFAGPQVRIGEYTWRIEDDQAKKRLRLVEDEEGRIAIRADDL